MAQADSEVAWLLAQIDEAYGRKAWHGPTLRGAVRGVSAGLAVRRPAAGRHNIQEVVIHCAYWKYAARRQAMGDQRGSFPIAGSNWFTREGEDAASWKRDLALLAAEHLRLREAIARLSGRDLHARPEGSKYTRAFILRGVAAHDLYHAGQIQLLKRLVG